MDAHIIDSYLNLASQAGQGHLFDGWAELNDSQRSELLEEVKVREQHTCWHLGRLGSYVDGVRIVSAGA